MRVVEHLIYACKTFDLLHPDKCQQITDQEIAQTADSTFSRDIPLTREGDTVSYNRIVKIFEHNLGLPSMESGVEQKERRVWYNYARQDSV